MNEPLWRPPAERVEASALRAFARELERRHGVRLPDYPSLHRYSVAERERFWCAVWDSCGVIGERGTRVLEDGDALPGSRWFPEARLNFAENLLRRSDDAVAIVAHAEGAPRRELSWRELNEQVSRVQQWLRGVGIGAGDRVAGVLPNGPEAVVAMLAAASLGALWSSCSPDFGARGVLDRFGQIEPSVLFCCDGYRYAGVRHDVLARAAEIRSALPSLRETVLVADLEPNRVPAQLPGARAWPEILAAHAPRALHFERLPFAHPLYVLYSSGTTGVPKCIVHGAGGTLLQHLKEHRLHVELAPGDAIFYFTTLGWMMWNWLVSALASEARVVLYDGSPFHPDARALFALAERERLAVLGLSAKFIDTQAKSPLVPRDEFDLSSVRTLLSTGSPLSPEGFDFVYERVKRDVCLSSVSGGTDIVSCFVAGSPTLPVYRGELQCAGLGMDTQVFDAAGRAVVGQKGELVCARSFPSLPLGFWNDAGGARFREAYFARFPGVWSQGDFAEQTPNGGFFIYGRSDAVLNPGGVRIGTAEIYRPVERIPEVQEALAIGQEWRGDVRIVLFVVLRPGLALDAALCEKVRARVRSEASPRHVPARILQVPDLPRTRSGKIAELAVRKVVHGHPIENAEALANPEALAHFAARPELAE
jgi:acetoacetyl-CoA synthetase